MRKIAAIAALFFLGTLSACEETYIPPTQQLNFTGTPYVLNVASINVADEYQSSKEPPHVELLADIPPAQAVHQWVQSRLLAKGNAGHAEVVIKDAHIIRKILPKQKGGVAGYFTNEQTQELDGRLEVEIKLYDGVGIFPVGDVHVSSEASMTLAENATLVDVRNAYHTVSVSLMNRLQPELESNIQDHLGKYLM